MRPVTSRRENPSIIVIAFLTPLAIYLLVMGYINRLPRPVMVSGVMDGIGLLCAASGFVGLGGPVLLSSVSDRWRLYWLLGESSPWRDLFTSGSPWQVLAVGYFLLVVTWAAVLLYRRRATTCIYNAEPGVIEEILGDACGRLGLEPIQTNGVFVFGLLADNHTPPAPTGVQAPHALHVVGQIVPESEPPLSERPDPALVGLSAVLELEAFHPLKHVTLHWSPAHSPLRTAVETELAVLLEHTAAPDHETGVWLNMLAWGLLMLNLLVLVALTVRMVYPR